MCAIYEWETHKEINQWNNPIHDSFNKYFGINQTNEVKDIYYENFQTLKKEIEEDTRNEKKHHACVLI